MDLERLKELAGITESKSVYELSPEQLKSNIEHVKDQMGRLPKDHYSYKDLSKELERYEKVLKDKEVKESKLEESKDDLWVLYTAKKGTDEFHPQFSGTKKDCQDEWRDTKKDWEGYDHKIEKHVEKEDVKESIKSLTEVAPEDQEDFVKDVKADFKKRYGKRWKQVLYATAWKRHNNEATESTPDEINHILKEYEKIAELAGVELTEEWEPKIEKLSFKEPPVNYFKLKAVGSIDDPEDAKAELTGQDKLEETKIKVPKSVMKAIDQRIKELEETMEKDDVSGPLETTRDELNQFKTWLKSGDMADFQKAQLRYGQLWSEIENRLPTSLVYFLHTGKEINTSNVQQT